MAKEPTPGDFQEVGRWALYYLDGVWMRSTIKDTQGQRIDKQRETARAVIEYGRRKARGR